MRLLRRPAPGQSRLRILAAAAGSIAALAVGLLLLVTTGGTGSRSARSAVAAQRGALVSARRQATISAGRGATISTGRGATITAGRQATVSGSCRGQSTEVEQAVDPGLHYVYETWIGCGGIGFARSTNGGSSFQRPIHLSHVLGFDGFTDDPAIAVSPSGAVYVSFIAQRGASSFPVIATSLDDGVSFARSVSLRPPRNRNFGDRSFLAAGPGATVYLTWDYGRREASVDDLCAQDGTCSFTAGELNIVLQRSTDGARTFGPIRHVSPGFPIGGADSGPILLEPDGRVDVLYQAYNITDRATARLGRGHTYFTYSTDHGESWSAPVQVGGAAGSMSTAEWWIDGNFAIDGAGNLFATWDTQAPAGAKPAADTGWLSYSTDHGRRWSTPAQVTPDHRNVPHIVEVTSVAPSVACVAWLSKSDRRGYAMYVRLFKIGRGWLTPAIRVSSGFGAAAVSPGDTFGISSISPTKLLIAFGSATAPEPSRSRIFAVPVSVRVP